jgi:hypothetical protein
MALGAELTDGELVDLHFHHRLLGRVEVDGISRRQFDGGQQSVVQGDRQQALVLLFHLGQQARGLALQDALNATFG